jgi:hypothetical protein
MPGAGGVTYDLVRGDLGELAGDARAVDLGLLTCIEDDSQDESSETFPDGDIPAPDAAFFYLVRFEDDTVVGPWGFGSGDRERTGAGGCPP